MINYVQASKFQNYSVQFVCSLCGSDSSIMGTRDPRVFCTGRNLCIGDRR